LSIDFSKIRLKRLSDEEIRHRTDEFREKYWGEKLPIDVDLIVERNLDLLIIPVPDLRFHAHTDAYLSGNLREIVIDPASPDVRIRFSVAHEIGHFVLHKDIISQLRSTNYEEWKAMQRGLPEALWGRAEYQAREFAGRLLVPPTLLIQELKALRPLIEKGKQILPDLEESAIRELAAPKLAKRFFVSDEVITRRMIAEGISPIQ
jgi:Zn-dependent peptidase ImmA (M78 family)